MVEERGLNVLEGKFKGGVLYVIFLFVFEGRLFLKSFKGEDRFFEGGKGKGGGGKKKGKGGKKKGGKKKGKC